MSSIYINVSNVQNTASQMQNLILRSERTKKDVEWLSSRIEGAIKNRRNIQSRLKQLEIYISEVQSCLIEINSFSMLSVCSYVQVDDYLCGRIQEILGVNNLNNGEVSRSSEYEELFEKQQLVMDNDLSVTLIANELEEQTLDNYLPWFSPIYDLVDSYYTFSTIGIAMSLKNITTLYPNIAKASYATVGKYTIVKGAIRPPGIGTRYVTSNLNNYPNAQKYINSIDDFSKLNKVASRLEKVSKGVLIVGGVYTAADEIFFKNQDESVSRKIGYAVVETSIYAGSAAVGGYIGTLVGGAVGSIVPIAGTAAGAAIGAVVGAGVAYGVAWGIDKLADIEVYGESARGWLRDKVGDASEAIGGAVVDLGQNIVVQTQAFGESIMESADMIGQAASDMKDSVVDGIASVGDAFSGVFSKPIFNW